MTVKLNPPLNDLSDSDLMWEFTNFDVEDWMASYFPREHYINKRYRRLMLEMSETSLMAVGRELRSLVLSLFSKHFHLN